MNIISIDFQGKTWLDPSVIQEAVSNSKLIKPDDIERTVKRIWRNLTKFQRYEFGGYTEIRSYHQDTFILYKVYNMPDPDPKEEEDEE